MSVEKQHILIIDDDLAIGDLLQQYLGGEGFEVASVVSGVEMDAYLASHSVDLFILDIMLPGEDGLSIARRLRRDCDTPILMLSARGDDVDRIVGLEVGADDYLPKPFNPRELLARVRAVLRRNHLLPEEVSANIFQFGPFVLDTSSQRLNRDGVDIPLTSGEYTLLKVFVEHPNRVLSRDVLMDLLAGHDRAPFDRSIDVRVTRLRRKIEEDHSEPAYIRTVWGEGYRFAPA